MFYSFARHRKRNNFISKPVTDEGEVLTKHEDKEQNIFNFYNTLLEKCDDREVIVNLEELHLPRFDLVDLDNPFLEEEVWKNNWVPASK